MATVLFDDNFTEKEKVILTKTFRANCEHLDITNRDCTVTVRREDIGPKKQLGSMRQLTPDHFLVLLNSTGFNLFEGISVFGHEMVHVAQYLRGDLTDEREGCGWRGQLFPSLICQVIYKELPWEQEAFELQPKLHRHSIDSLHRAEVQHVLDVSRHAYV